MRRMVRLAPAKLNLHLGIYSELDSRRYHRADSLMVALDLADEVIVEEVPAGAAIEGELPTVTCVPPVGIPAYKNTACRAARALCHRYEREANVYITIHKHVPDQSGMGGSSSDAAAVLLALCDLWGVDPSDAKVLDAARAVGADVPFFLDPVPTLLVGAGDVVGEKFAPLEEAVSVVLLRPEGPGVSTPVAYAEFDKNPTEPANPASLCNVLRSGMGSAESIAPLLENNLDPVACSLLPRVAEVRAWLLAQVGVLGGQVTGSGSCIFGICESDEVASSIARNAKERFPVWAVPAHIV